MKVRDKTLINPFQVLVLSLGTALLAISNPLAAQEIPSIAIDGSSTVYPITKNIVEDYQATVKKPVEIKVEFSGTGGGFDKFCNKVTFYRGEVGTVLDGQSQFNVTIPQLLRKQARY